MHTILTAIPNPDFFILTLRSQVFKSIIQRLTYLCFMEKLGQPSNTTVFIYIHLDFLNQQNDTRIGTDFFYVAVIVVLSILYVRQIVPSNIPVPVS
jgi:hypothetical protein